MSPITVTSMDDISIQNISSTTIFPLITSTIENCNSSKNYRPLTVTNIDYVIQHYIFPVQFIFGVSGNCLNLLVLLSSSMKNQANTLLSAMAFADLAFLFCMLPYSLASFEPFYASPSLKKFFYLYRAHGVGIANFFSIAATWLVLAVSIERFSGVRRPMHTRFQLRDRRLLSLIGIIFSFSFLLSLFQHFEYRVEFKTSCGDVTPNIAILAALNTTSPLLLKYIKISKYTQMVLGCILPVLAVAVLNVSLIYFLRKREIIPRYSGRFNDPELRRTSDFGTFQKQERKVTATVLSIVTCFSITHLPSLVPYVYEILYGYIPIGHLNDIMAILNNLLVCGKVLNFVLFCTSSTHFRRRTMIMLNSWSLSRRKKYSSMPTTTSNIPQSNSHISSKQLPILLQSYRKRQPLQKTSTISSQFE